MVSSHDGDDKPKIGVVVFMDVKVKNDKVGGQKV